ncbi:choice-of-anchor M domain-containing protein [Streptomyces sp. NPDC057245]|uniref:choice-of-anchor M domain-containing protein n=1 Tax=Streptomyces TaxID=1883 RepID=UPI001C1E4F95|nr:choice-of-anchor M domain-containing protein [Streptomyces sp. A108]MBU6530345.1 TIGR03769 domain-containing protein [Streptomyces sp. A108]
MRTLTRVACVLGALCTALAGPVLTAGGAHAAAADTSAGDVLDERVVIDRGHVDAVAPRMVDGRLRTLFRDSRTSDVVWREPGSVIMHLTAGSRNVVPDPAGGSAFIGEPGQVYYLLPQTQDPALLWAGWSTEAFEPSSVQGRFSFSLDEVEGPGSLLVFNWSPFGEPLMRFDSRDGLPDAYAVPAVTHEHANWVFTEQGVYRMTFTVAATLATGEEVKDSQTYTMAVGDVDPDDVPLPGDPGDPGGDPGGVPGGDSGGVSGGAGGGDSGGGSGEATGGGSAGGSGGSGDSGGVGGVGGGGSGGDSGGAAGGGSGAASGGDAGGATGAVAGGGSDGGTGTSTSAGTGTSTSAGTGTSAGTTAGTGTGTGPAARASGSGGGELARTGAGAAVPLVVGGAGAVLLGAGALYLVRRGRPASDGR